ncbi:glycosyltransferase family 2 protein [Alginatibacterium sediminis]|uniref:glycosyltransferase family 2 protein n=1 Tax=Alginatibacterium sediminis TaxID=2164068 RepID=UPI001314D9CD|nr:glycosyltransferase family 2 protein [Alginatibacterium sediminis]
MYSLRPLVTIVTPCYNAQTSIQRCVESVLAQSYPRWEMILVSDDHHDYLTQLKRAGINDPRIRQYQSPTVKTGPNAPRNIALANAKGDYFAPLDADDFYYPKRLELLLPAVRAFGIAADNTLVVDELTDKLLYVPFPQGEQWQRISLGQFLKLSTPIGLVFRRDFITYGWNEGVELGEDTLVNLRAIARLGYLPFYNQGLHEYRIHDNSICHHSDAAQKAERAYTYTLQALADPNDGMGFNPSVIKDAISATIRAKQSLNNRYSELCNNGYTGSFQDFIAQRSTQGYD